MQREKELHAIRTPQTAAPSVDSGLTDSEQVLKGYLTPEGSLAACDAEKYPVSDRPTPYLDEDDEVERIEPELFEIVTSNWNSIKSFHKCHRVVDVLNVRVWEPTEYDYDIKPENVLRSIWKSERCRVKINASAGCILQHKETGQYRYFHSSSNNATVFEKPIPVSSTSDMDEVVGKLSATDISAKTLRMRPNTHWRLHALTNLTFYIYKMPGVGRVGRGKGECPKHIRDCPHVIGLYTNPKTGKAYDDNLCMFRCLALLLECTCDGTCRCRTVRELSVKSLYRKFCSRTPAAISSRSESFKGVEQKELTAIERIFKVRLTVFTLEEKDDADDNIARVVWCSGKKRGRRLNVLLTDQHFSYIRDVNSFSKSYVCYQCGATFTRAQSCRRHKCKVEKITDFTFPGGLFQPGLSIFDEIERETGISVDNDLRFHPYRATFDIEAMLPSHYLPAKTETLTFENEHRLVSISACSNVPGFEDPKCFVVNGEGAGECVSRFVDYIASIATRAGELLRGKLARVREMVERSVRERESLELPYADIGMSSGSVYKARAGLGHLCEKLDRYATCLPIIGFNSQRYDINVMKGALMKRLFGSEVKTRSDNTTFIVKRQDAMTCVQTEHFRFLDIVNFMSPGFNYASYLKAFGVEEQKGFFPYEWLDSLDKLDQTTLPPRSAFFSKLKQESISEEDYRVVLRAWHEHGMKSVRDLLIWYNNLDVKPFLTALERQATIYREKDIDMLTRAISLPGLAVLWMFKIIGRRLTLREAYELRVRGGESSHTALERAVVDTRRLHLIDRENGELYDLFRKNLVGGPSLVFHRYHEAGKTVLRANEGGTELCQQILGVDANALYLFCLMQDMPVGRPRIRTLEDNFAVKKTQVFGKMSQGWLAWQEFQTNTIIETALCEGEKHLGRHNLPVDGYCHDTKTVYEFNGCYWHGHGCSEQTSKDISDFTATARQERTELKREYLEHLGYTVVSIWECEWRKQVNRDPSIKEFLKSFYNRTYGDERSMTQERILQQVSSGKLFGFVECDIRVPDHLLEKFSEMPPIFKNVNLTRDHLSEHMRAFAEEEGYLKRPQRYLIGSMFGKQILLLTELLKWYLQQGLVVDKVYKVIEFERAPILKSFGDSVTEARRGGDTDSSQKLLANTAKLIGNSLYGKTIVDKTKHRKVGYSTDEAKVSQKIASRLFHSLNILDEGVFETISFKSRVCYRFLSLLVYQRKCFKRI